MRQAEQWILMNFPINPEASATEYAYVRLVQAQLVNCYGTHR